MHACVWQGTLDGCMYAKMKEKWNTLVMCCVQNDKMKISSGVSREGAESMTTK